MEFRFYVCCVVQSQSPKPFAGEFIARHMFPQPEANINNNGIAVSNDSRYAVISHGNDTLTVYALPSFTLLRTLGAAGGPSVTFSNPMKLCFTLMNTILVADNDVYSVKEVSLDDELIRSIGTGLFTSPLGAVATNDELIAVSDLHNAVTSSGWTERIWLFSAESGQHLRVIDARLPTDPGFLRLMVSGVRFFTYGGVDCVVAVERHAYNGISRLGVFTADGQHGKHIGERLGVLSRSHDVAITPTNQLIVADNKRRSTTLPELILLSPEIDRKAHEVTRIQLVDPASVCDDGDDGDGDDDGPVFLEENVIHRIQHRLPRIGEPIALALAADGRLYVLDESAPQVFVFA